MRASVQEGRVLVAGDGLKGEAGDGETVKGRNGEAEKRRSLSITLYASRLTLRQERFKHGINIFNLAVPPDGKNHFVASLCFFGYRYHLR